MNASNLTRSLLDNAAVAASIRDRSIHISRRVAAPRARVFDVFTDPLQIAAWWGPAGFRNTVHSMDVRAGGSWRYTMHGPDGKDWLNWVNYTEVTPPARLAYRHGDEDADGTYRHAFDVTIDFADDGPGHTRVSMTMLFPDRAARDRTIEQVGALDGAEQNMDRLETYLAEELVITRRFAAPRTLIWTMLSEPAHLEKWWGPAGHSLDVVSLDFRPGGRFHYRMGEGAIAKYGVFHYREIDAPKRLVFTNSFADADGNPVRAPFSEDWPLHVLNEWTLEEADGITTLHLQGRPLDADAAGQEIFHGMFESMRGGFGATFDQLATHLEEYFRERGR